VTSPGGTPTGTVQFRDGSTPIGSAVTLAAGQATLQNSSLAAGSHSITAVYASDTVNYSGSTSTAIAQTIRALTPTFSLTPLQPIKAGTASITAGGKIAAGSVIPTGTVSVSLNGSQPQFATIGADGSFSTSLNTSALSAGSYPIAYAYTASANFNGATANDTLTVIPSGPVTSQITLIASANPVMVGQKVTLTAQVPQLGNMMPTGNVTLAETETQDTPPQAIVPPNIFGQGDLVDGVYQVTLDSSTFQYLTTGAHTLFATYSGDANYNASTSLKLLLTVTPGLGEGAPDPKPALKITTASVKRSGESVTVQLKIDNTGTGTALDALIQQIDVRTLAGSGTATVVTPLPIEITQIDAGGTVTKTITLNVPATVQRISITEAGTLRGTTMPSSAFTAAQSVIIPN